MALHEQATGATDEWYTPPHVFAAMAVRFDTDVAHPGLDVLPWVPADLVLTGGSLERDWSELGFIWMNPPFGGRNGLAPWLEKFFAHGNGVALVPDRTSAPWWHYGARRANAMLHVGRQNPTKGSPNKLRFIGRDGKPGNSPAQGTTLFSAGPQGLYALQNAVRAGLGLLSIPTPMTSSR